MLLDHIRSEGERNAFCYFRSYFFALNLVIVPMLQNCLGNFLMIFLVLQDSSIEKCTDRIVKEALIYITEFFQLLAVIENINKVYHYELLTLHNREKVEIWVSILDKANEELSQVLKLQIPN